MGRLKHYALLSEYDGSVFHGWQEQANAETVQGHIRQAWKKITGENLHFRGSSRTDAGVSAGGHVCDFYTRSQIPYTRIPRILNGYLPPAIAIRGIQPVSDSFDARYDSIGKLYIYHVWQDPLRTGILRSFCSHFPQKVDLKLMEEAAKYLVGIHDCTAFMDQGSPVRRTVRQIDRISVIRERASPLIRIYCLGRGFLYHQVRIIAGTLLYVGQGKLTIEEMLQAREEKDRRKLGKTMPPEGLLLKRVYYPQALFYEDGEESYEKMITHNHKDLMSLKYI